jgi:hypothetical protein
MPTREELGRVVYEAYLRAYRDLGDESSGLDLGWGDVPEVVREASRRAAEAVREAIEREGRGDADDGRVWGMEQ